MDLEKNRIFFIINCLLLFVASRKRKGSEAAIQMKKKLKVEPEVDGPKFTVFPKTLPTPSTPTSSTPPPPQPPPPPPKPLANKKCKICVEAFDSVCKLK